MWSRLADRYLQKHIKTDTMDILSKVKENLDVIRDRKFINDDFMLNNDCAREL